MDVPLIQSILICGAGTMGTGIAQVSIESGIKTYLFDTDASALSQAEQQINKFLTRKVDKGTLQQEALQKALDLLVLTSDFKSMQPEFVIEAVQEQADVKVNLFKALAEHLPEQTILATNTSSISVSAIAATIPHPERVAGMHFFNPAPLMELVEIVQASRTSVKTLETITALARQLNKTPVLVHDTPGFVVNRVARHYYLEAFKIAAEGRVKPEAIDKLLESAGFKMGPFALTDLIGQDVNLAVTESLYASFYQEPRFRPSRIQAAKVQAGFLGIKSGKGFYDYK